MNSIKYILFLLLLCSAASNAQTDADIERNSFYYPHSLQLHKKVHTIGFSTASLPEDVIESDDAVRAPLVYYKMKYGLGKDFLLESSLKTNFITLHAATGPKWTHEFGRFTMSAGVEGAFYYGYFAFSDFDSRISGWQAYPNITLGYLFPNFSVTFKSEAIVVLDQSIQIGHIDVTSDYRTFSGFSFGAYLEQPLFRDYYFVFGLKANYTRFYYPMWIAFSTFDRNFFIPEVMFSFNL